MSASPQNQFTLSQNDFDHLYDIDETTSVSSFSAETTVSGFSSLEISESTAQSSSRDFEQKDEKTPLEEEEKKSAHSDEECAICLGTIDDRARLNLCCHSFCSVCIRQWTQSQLTLKPFEEPDTQKKVSCPKCRANYTSLLTNIVSDSDFKEEILDLTPKPDTSLFDSLVRALRVLLTRTPDQFDNIPIDPSLPAYYRRLHELAFSTPAFRSLVKQFGSRLTEENIKEIANVIYKTLEQRHRQSQRRTGDASPRPYIPANLSVRTIPFHFPRQPAQERYQVYESALRAQGVPTPNGRRFLMCGLNSSIASYAHLVALDNPNESLNQPPEHNSMVMWILDELETLMGPRHSERVLQFIIKEMPLVLLCCRRYVRDIPVTPRLRNEPSNPIRIQLTREEMEGSKKQLPASSASPPTSAASSSLNENNGQSSSPEVPSEDADAPSTGARRIRVITDSTVNPFLHPSTHRLYLQFSDVLRPALARRCELFVYRMIALTCIMLRERVARDGITAVIGPAPKRSSEADTNCAASQSPSKRSKTE